MLVTALLLVGLLAAVVLAQSSGNKTIAIGGTNQSESTYTLTYGTDSGEAAEFLADGDAIGTFSIPTTSVDAVTGPPAEPAVIGLDEGDDPQGIAGYQVDSDLFEISDGGAVTVSTGAAAKLNDPDQPNVFTFNVNIFVDTNTDEDGDSTKTLSEEETANEGARDGFEQATGADDDGNDLDEVNSITVIVRILKAADADFAAVPGMASVNDVLYGTEGESQGVAITGLTSDMTIIGGDNITGNNAIYGVANAQNVVSLKYLLPSGAALDIADTDRSTEVTIEFTVAVDTDKDNADGTGDGTATDAQGDLVENNAEDDLNVTFTASITVYNVMSFAEEDNGLADAARVVTADGSSDKPYSSSIRSSATEGTQADVITIDGAASDEDVDVIVRGSGPFTASPRKTGAGDAAAYTQVVIMASRDLTTADEGMHNLVVTINGRALPTRTVQAHVKVQVTASNPVPTSPYGADNPLTLEIAESDDEVGTLGCRR